MKLSVILPTVLLASTIDAACNTGGETWGGAPDTFAAHNFARDVCGSELMGQYSGAGDPGGDKEACREHAGKKYVFHIWRYNSPTPGVMDPETCLQGMANHITSCPHGGDTATATGWRYM
jgi:hypothetical protein